MDIRGTPPDFTSTIEFNDRMYSIYTASPGVIESFDGTLAKVRISIRMKSIENGEVKYLDPPLITNVPVVLPSSVGGGLFLTVPIKAGDPCLLIFGQRGIDNVVELGGMQNPVDNPSTALTNRIRHHDMTDAICIPGLSVKPSAPASWSLDGIEMRNSDRTVFVKVKATGIESKGTWTHTGDLTTTGDVTAGTVHLKTHTHPQSGGGNTGAPNV